MHSLKIIWKFLAFTTTLSTVAIAAPVIRTSTSGHKFTLILHPELGNGWKDEKGVVWYDAAKDGDGGYKSMRQTEAIAYCVGVVNPIGNSPLVHLPNLTNFEDLKVFLGKGSDSGYIPEILPNLNAEYWSTAVAQPYYMNDTEWPLAFYGLRGTWMLVDPANDRHVRCVGN